MKLSICLHTSEHRGDHIADVDMVYELRPEETIDALAERLFGDYPKDGDYISIRRVVEATPKDAPF